jgi:hypothetical protein
MADSRALCRQVPRPSSSRTARRDTVPSPLANGRACLWVRGLMMGNSPPVSAGGEPTLGNGLPPGQLR